MAEFPAASVGFTAKVMAAGRAIESRRPDGLFIDPFAASLAGEAVIEATIPRMEEYEREGRPFSVVRTRCFDDFLLAQRNLRGKSSCWALEWTPGHSGSIGRLERMFMKSIRPMSWMRRNGS